MIPITKPFLPPIEKYQKLLQGIWDREILTNNGTLVKEFEEKLKNYFSLNDLLYLNNGTIAIQIAIKALSLKGEIITTPFTYIATSSSIVWEGCIPVFVDIDEKTLNINPEKIELAITPKTSAILATHVYGNPCEIERIEKIAIKNKLKVIYDAAHCFGTKYNGRSVFEFGDISTTSFHATKLFHTIEGGAVFSSSPDLITKMAFLRNFGHHGPENFAEIGINGKNSEFHAAMGILNLSYVDEILDKRKKICDLYRKHLNISNIKFPETNKKSEINNAYFSVIFECEEILLKVVDALLKNDIAPRRYFYPSLNTISIFKSSTVLPISESISKRVLCLPLYHNLTDEEVIKISSVIIENL